MSDDTRPSSIRRYASNAASLLTSDVLNKATTFLIYALVSRHLGTREFGQLSLGLLLFYAFQVFATAGLPTLVTRSVAQHPRRTGRYFVNGLVTAGAVSGLSTVALLLLAIVMQYDRDTTLVICVLAGGLLPYSLALVIESLFRGCEQMHFIAIANVVTNFAKACGAFYLLFSGYGVLAIAGLLIGVRILIFVIELALFVRYVNHEHARLRFRFAYVLLRRSLTFFGIDAVTASWASVDALLLSKLATEVEVGLFCAAAQLLQPILLVYKSVVSAVFPSMCHRAASGSQGLVAVSRWLVSFLAMIGLPVVILLGVFADLALRVCYGDEDFQRTVPLLQLMTFTLVIQSITTVLGHALWASSREKTALRIVTTNLVANIIIGYLLVSWFGALGAAIAFLAIAILNGLQHCLAVQNVFQTAPFDLTLFVPVVAATLMIASVLAIPDRRIGAVVGTSAYVICVGLSLLRRYGSWRELPARYFAPLLNS